MFLKKKLIGILPILLIAGFVLLKLLQFVEIDFSQQREGLLHFVDVELTEDEADRLDRDFIPGIEYISNLTGTWAVRFLLAAFLMSPVSLLIGRSFPLYFRQSVGIATGVFTMLHVFVFIYTESFLSVFSRAELILGFLAFLIILSLTLTSNKKAMKLLKRRWKRLHRWVYLAVLLVMLHLIILDHSWLVYGILFAFGFVFRIKSVKRFIKTRL
ncbi:sulfoxide reductase heme-binding subunit YedZ [Ancylomarina subtilis]|uniref:Sulfoxide reductase heme-binding subunit YedZ n=1 Tax=Ancylomarina subtilis TaxID=1639035 RepID=A0A4Q7VHH4_9BACT|nr:ferric reductase-like transmembrane domain-containing protein [Ancylomarina subtilis]RZT95542.1 sulfoxide reductase heme-binding subunit YedZ [Ancylomarina subtilis]